MGNKDFLGDRMKKYENKERSVLIERLPVVARLDGRAFSSFTADMESPFSYSFTHLMQNTTSFLVKAYNAAIGYTQSDEITLVWYDPEPKGEFLFGGNIQKLSSILASDATLYFNSNLACYLWPRKGHTDQLISASELLLRRPMFDCRFNNVPTDVEAVNNLIWREKDAMRNSVQKLAQSIFSQLELDNRNTATLKQMIKSKGQDWDSLAHDLQRGSFYRRKKVWTRFDPQIDKELAPLHDARKNPDLLISRSVFEKCVFDTQLAYIPNRVRVVFGGADPIYNAVEIGLESFIDESLDSKESNE